MTRMEAAIYLLFMSAFSFIVLGGWQGMVVGLAFLGVAAYQYSGADEEE